MKLAGSVFATSFAWSCAVGGQTTRAGSPSSTDSAGVYRGVYASTVEESVFSACDTPDIGSGWSLRFAKPEDARFLQHNPRLGNRVLAHFIRVRGRVSAPGNYGRGFQFREIVVDSVMEISETPQPCPSYEDTPLPWSVVESSGARIIGTAVSHDRSLLAIMDLEGVISIWSTTERKLAQRFPSEDKGELFAAGVSMAFTRDAGKLAVGATDGSVRVWNPSTGTRLREFAAMDTVPGTQNGRRVVARSAGLTFNQGGTLLANMLGEKTVILSITTGKRIGSHDDGLWPGKFLFVGDSSFIASGDSGFMKIYPRLGAPPIWRVKIPVQRFDVMEVSPDARWLAVKSWGDTVYLWSLSDGQPGPRIVVPAWSGSNLVAFSPDGNTVATTGGVNGLYVWETKTGRPLRSFQNFPWNLQRIWFTADGASIVTYSSGESVFRIVHLDSARRRRDASAAAEPGQATWPAYIDPARQAPDRVRGSVSGFVRLSPSRGLPGAEISLFDGDRPGAPPLARTSTNSAGHFLIQKVRVPHVVVHASKRGFSSAVRYGHFLDDRLTFELELKATR